MELPGRWRGSAAKSGIAALLCFAVVAGEAAAADNVAKLKAARAAAKSGAVTNAGNPVIRGLLGMPVGRITASGQHGPTFDHLPSARENVKLLSKLELETPDAYKFDPDTGDPDPTEPDIVPGQIADVSTYKGAAYLASWAEPSCKRGGFFSVDVTDPEDPEQLAFVPALPDTYHGEGMHTITLNTPDFQGDVLAVNNEPCGPDGVGGFDLYDVTDPANPEILVQGYGDQSPPADPGDAKGPTTQDPGETPNSAHSIYIWQDGAEAYAVIVDNTEFSDVDIFNITDPENPEFITDLDLLEQAIDQNQTSILQDSVGLGFNIFLHDMVVKQINGQQIMLASYWDIGYIKVNVSDPENPVIIGDSSWGDEDPIMKIPGSDEQWSPSEGNAHQGEFSHDNKFVLTADEDFAQYRLLGEVDKGGGDIVRFFEGGAPTEGPQITVADGITGGTRFVGRGCVAADIPLATAGRNVAVIERGDCDFQDKVENADARGYSDVIIFNGNNPASAENCEGLLNMTFEGYTGDAKSIFVTREVGFHIIGAWTAGYACAQAAPAAPKDTFPVSIGAGFDGWGYMHLYDNSGANLTSVDHFAIEEAQDERYAFGFGDLTVHEFATDPTEDLAYSAYYAGGLRVMSFADADGDGDRDLEEVGKFIDKGGNNFWGVEVYDDPDDGRIVALSDRDFGLYLTQYTGEQQAPAPTPPVCGDASATTAHNTAVSVRLSCKDVNPLSYEIVTPPTKGTLGAITNGRVLYTPNAGSSGADTFTFRANDGAFDSDVATATVVVGEAPAPQPTVQPNPTPTPTPSPPTAPASGACANDIAGTASRDLLKGTSAGERIMGGRGNDVIDGEAGDDCISGEAGNDVLSGDAGNDDVMGGAGSDDVAGGAGRDEVDGGSGSDDLDGGSGNDTLVGGSGGDRIVTGAGTDRVRAGSGNDRITARGGGKDTIDCGAGRDTVTVDKSDKVARNCEVVRRR